MADYNDRDVGGSALGLGREASEEIQLQGVGIAPKHALIAVSTRGSALKCVGDAKVMVGGNSLSQVALAPGTEILIGTHRLVVIDPPPGFELALELHFGDGLKAEDFEKTFTTRLTQTSLRRRPLAWASVVVILVALFGLPLWQALSRNAGHPLPAAVSRFLPSDRLWTPGSLVPAHQQAIGDNCGACHQKMFVPVQDKACSACHQSIHEHVAPEHLKLTQFAKAAPSCESCHREHQDPSSAIIVKDNGLCVGCHGKDSSAFGSLDIKTVKAFSAATHPEFKVHLLKPVADDPQAGTEFAQWQYVATALDGAKESSNLKFSHKQHLDPKVSSNRHDGGMGCTDCHVANLDGFRFAPVTMRDACISCHELTFDPLEPRRQLPHGRPREVIATIEEFYARRYLEPSVVPTATFVRRHTPGEDDKVDVIKCADSAANCAQQSASRTIESQFKVRGCASCHQISDTQNKDIAERFQVLAVRLGNEFYPHALFKHGSHLIQGKLTGDAACKSCHAADKAEDSTQMLIPGMQNCLGCHTDKSSDRRPTEVANDPTADAAPRRSIVPLGCIGCHRYHLPLTARDQALATNAAR